MSLCPMKTIVYAFGSNGAGQLGIGHFDDVSTPSRCQFVAYNHTTPYKAYLLGNGNGNGHVTKIVGGGNHTLIRLSSGPVYATGSNEDGRCGLSENHHSVDTTTGSAVNYEGQLVADFVEIPPFYNLEIGNKGCITDVAATWSASFFVLEYSRVFVCGAGQKGELGLGPDFTTCRTRSLVLEASQIYSAKTSMPRIKSISGSMNHVVIVFDNGDVYGWGSCRKGQLGEENMSDKILWRPRKLQVRFPAKEVVVGREYTFIIGEQGQQIFLGNAKNFELPLRLTQTSTSDTGVRLHSGWSSIIAHSIHNQTILGFGRNDRGQLPPPDLPPSRSVATGSEHSIAVLNDGSLVAWGWGEHGNCGSPTDVKGDVKNRWNIIDLKEMSEGPTQIKITGVGAGCATSFVIVEMETSQEDISEMRTTSMKF